MSAAHRTRPRRRVFAFLGVSMPAAPTNAQLFERLARDMHELAFDCGEPAWNHREAERRIAEVERICAEARAAVRGRG